MKAQIRNGCLARQAAWALIAAGLVSLGCTHASRSEAPTVLVATPLVRTPDLRPALSPEMQAQLRPSGLPALGEGPWSANPYRGQDGVVETGRGVFHAACARCHGVGAEPTPEAPDLRRLPIFCRRLAETAWKDRCLSDVDRHFWASVQEGKVRAGVVYMPSWRGTLTPEAIWAVRTYLESLTPAAPARPPARPGHGAP